MVRAFFRSTTVALAMTLTSAVLVGSQPVSQAAAPPVHALSVSGAGVGMYPTFSSSVRRYGVTTDDTTGGAVTVRATTSDTRGTVLVDGRPVTGGQTTLQGLQEGDEISVIFVDSAGRSANSLVYLPTDFPTLERTTPPSSALQAGSVALTLTIWNGTKPSFETIVDRNGVPSYVRSSSTNPMDLKRQPDGNLSVIRPDAGAPGARLVELDDQLRPLTTHTVVGLTNLDAHDSIALPNGHVILLAYQPREPGGLVDSVIQELDEHGDVVFQWDSRSLASETVVGSDKDYAHINSVQLLPDGDLLASFRHLSAVVKIARTAHDGYQPGDVVWKLGGRDSDFTFAHDPYPGGPCAQHTAYQLANGHVMVYDNGSGGIAANMCIDPADPTGPTIARTFTRITEYAIQPPQNGEKGTATLVWSWVPDPTRYGFFAGSAQRLPNGDTLVGHAVVRAAIASEVDPTGSLLWNLRDHAGSIDSATVVYSTYRAALVRVPDRIPPVVSLAMPADGATYDQGDTVVADYSCTDRGGSTLRTCAGPVLPGQTIDTTTPGLHTFAVSARDGADNVVTESRSYTVRASYQADSSIRALPDGAWVGSGLRGGPADQTIRQSIHVDGGRVRSKVRVDNTGLRAGRFRLSGTPGNKRFAVRYLVGTTDVTAAVVDGGFRTPVLDSGQEATLRIVVTRRAAARPGDTRVFTVSAMPVHDGTQGDAVATRVSATR